MSFKYSAFIENSKEAREWLESIGYDPCPCVGDDPGDLIFTDHTRGKFHGYDEEVYGDILAEREEVGGDEVDCRGNFDLFKAVTAVRDDGLEYMVWYINNHTGQWKQCDFYMMEDDSIDWDDWTEASLTELINHFKK